jgi:hypothetical protein
VNDRKPVRRIGKYELISKVAQGGMGALYKAKHPTLDRVVLLKKLTLRGSGQFVERFKREARLMMEFKHDHIVHVYDHFKEGSSYYIVEEFVDGISLDELIRKERFLSNDAAMLILYEVAKALKYAHDKGVIHRDIKPGNILISNQGEVKLVDFGIATSLEETDEGLTREGMVLGTPCYIPPEQIADAKNVDRRADIYSLGVVLYEMLTGKTPFPGSFTAETLSLIHKGRYLPPVRLNPKISPVLRKLVRKAMRVRPRRRFQDLRAMIRILERRIRRRDPASIRQAMKRILWSQPVREILRKRQPWVAPLVAALVVAVLLGAGGYYLYLQGTFFELFTPDRYGALVVSAQVARRYKEPGEIFLKATLYRERDSELARVEDIPWDFHEDRARDTTRDFVLESRKLYLPPGQYRLKVSLEGELYWSSFFLNPRTVQRQLLASAQAQEVTIRLAGTAHLPLRVEYAAFDLHTGEDLTASTSFEVFLGGRWQDWSQTVAEAMVSGTSYRFRFEHEGYAPRSFSLAIQPYQTLLRLETQLIPTPATLRLRSNSGGLSVSLDGSQYYFSGGKDRAYRRLDPVEPGTRELRLNPGRYRLTVERDSGLRRSLDIFLQPGRTVTVEIAMDTNRRTLDVNASE